MAKNGLMIFTNQRIPDPARPNKTIPVPRPPLIINGHTIAATDTHKFLGVILDQNLRFKQQADHAAAKGKFWVTQTRRVSKTVRGIRGQKGKFWVTQTRRVSKTVRGIRGHLARQLYTTVAIPKMLYAASVWLTPIT